MTASTGLPSASVPVARNAGDLGEFKSQLGRNVLEGRAFGALVLDLVVEVLQLGGRLLEREAILDLSLDVGKGLLDGRLDLVHAHDRYGKVTLDGRAEGILGGGEGGFGDLRIEQLLACHETPIDVGIGAAGGPGDVEKALAGGELRMGLVGGCLVREDDLQNAPALGRIEACLMRFVVGLLLGLRDVESGFQHIGIGLEQGQAAKLGHRIVLLAAIVEGLERGLVGRGWFGDLVEADR